MVKLMGHLAMALLFAAPAWLLWGRRPALAFAALTQVTAMLPDVDLLLEKYFGFIVHHGITHTLLFVSVAGVLFGAVAAVLFTSTLNAFRLIRSDDIPRETVFVFAAGAFVAGGTSHVFADLLSAPDIAAPLKPLWPLYDGYLIIDVIRYDSLVWNAGLLVVAIALHVMLYRAERYPRRTRFGIGDERR